MNKKEMAVLLSTANYRQLETMAAKAKISPAMLSSLLLEAFIENNGKVFFGEWAEGPGIRMLPDWPRFSSGVIKVKSNELV